jgi:xeroderma pigmentosum group C-complementing protein
MLREEEASTVASTQEDERPLKKRKTARSQKSSSPVAQPPSTESPTPAPVRAPLQVPVLSHSPTQPRNDTAFESRHVPPANGRLRQTIVDPDESDGSDEEWEDALVDGDGTDGQDEVTDVTPKVGDISITIGGRKDNAEETRRRVRRRAITSVDKKKRLDIHKMHVLCLLYHVYRRNVWCSDLRVQTTLRKLVPPKTLLNLVPNPDLTQYSASQRFINGLNELKMLWSKRFRLTAQGMYKPKWAEADADVRPFSDFDELDDPMDKNDFRKAAHVLQGSQDVGTQLFCALLRGIGIEARLVCSLQPLPFASSAQPITPQKSSISKTTIVVDPYNKPEAGSPSRPKASTSYRPKKLSRLERVMGERHVVLNKTGVAPQKQKAYHAPYPVYWVEVFNSAYQKWVTIDTHSTFTVNSPEKLEPPLSFAQNSLTYAIAFEEDYAAKDVTRRYAKAYSAKTRKFRVECTPHGTDWWRRVMKFFMRLRPLDRDQVEDAALARKEASEGIPKNVQDFRDHPVYVLERHLKHNEVIYPMTPVGKVNVGSAMNAKIEPIYRRKDVRVVRSADKWYRMGQDVLDGEQPLKHAKPKKGRQLSVGPEMDVDDQQDEVGAGLYAEFQTQLYVPPPVVRGRVPRNAYGNLDLYVPSMCPPGGVHIRHKLASKAARVVGVDYAEAVTGFSFKGRHGTAIVQGVVVAQEFAEAVQEVINGMEYEQEAAANAARTRESLRLWRRFFLGLRIAQRVNAIEIDGEKGPSIDVQGAIDQEDRAIVEKEMAGGFFPDEADFAESSRRGHEPPPQEFGGGFLVNEDEDEEDAGGFVSESNGERRGLFLNREHSFESSILDSQQIRPRRRSSLAGDYIAEDDDEGGGFVHEGSPKTGQSVRRHHKRNDAQLDDDAADDAASFSSEDEDTDMEEAIHASLQQQQPLPTETEANYASKIAGEVDVAITPDDDPSPPKSSPSDAGSLPLEDPEDEDADPDWLVDAT